MTLVATVLLLVALPFALWPLLRPPAPAGEAPPTPPEPGRDRLLQQVEELQLDLASGRIDDGEAGRRIAELEVAEA